MVMMEAFLAGDGSLDVPCECATFRYEMATGKVFRRFYGQPEREEMLDPAAGWIFSLTGPV